MYLPCQNIHWQPPCNREPLKSGMNYHITQAHAAHSSPQTAAPFLGSAHETEKSYVKAFRVPLIPKGSIVLIYDPFPARLKSSEHSWA